MGAEILFKEYGGSRASFSNEPGAGSELLFSGAVQPLNKEVDKGAAQIKT